MHEDVIEVVKVVVNDVVVVVVVVDDDDDDVVLSNIVSVVVSVVDRTHLQAIQPFTSTYDCSTDPGAQRHEWTVQEYDVVVNILVNEVEVTDDGVFEAKVSVVIVGVTVVIIVVDVYVVPKKVVVEFTLDSVLAIVVVLLLGL